MIPRHLASSVQELHRYFPIVYVGGPRQSGKTTLLQSLFAHLPYVNLENPDARQLAEQDPRRFLDNYPAGAILDEAQRVPHLFNYLQGYVDQNVSLRFILSGSQNYLMMESITQSLAGRVGILNLMPFSYRELPEPIQSTLSPEQWAWGGAFPALFDRQIPPHLFYANYLETYLQRDVRQLKQVGNLSQFMKFIQLCAGRVGQVMNLSSLANETDLAVNTIKSWLTVLEASWLVYILPPYYKNFQKRLIKSPKLYFTDTGLLCYLLGIKTLEQLQQSPFYGNILENMLVMEQVKAQTHTGNRPEFYFWRDSAGNEIDLVFEHHLKLHAIEFKAAKTFNTRFFSGLKKWQSLTGTNPEQCSVYYLGDQSFDTIDGRLVKWNEQ